jgi:hypothetical protein
VPNCFFPYAYLQELLWASPGGAVTFGGAVGQHQAIVAALGDALPRPADEPDAASEPSARSAP